MAGRGRRGPGWGWAIRESLCEEATGKLRHKGAGAQTPKRRQNSPEEKPKHKGLGLPDAVAARTSPSNAGVGVRPPARELRPHMPQNQTVKQKQYCNKFNKDCRNGPHQKIIIILNTHTYSLCSSVAQIVSNSLRPQGLQHTRPPCPSPTPGVCSNSCPCSQ